MSFRIVLLGTGGGRHTTMFQVRSTGGFHIDHDGGRIHVDPGPGALTQMHRIHRDPADTSAVLISHCHPDHYSDGECVVEGMTYGGWKKRGLLMGSVTVMEGQGGLGPCISKYHRNIAERTGVLHPGDSFEIDGLRVDITKAVHSDPTNVGFIFHTEHGDVAYVSDTEYSDEIADQYKGCRVVMLPITTPLGERIKYHMCMDDAILFEERIKPELAVFVHLGIVMIKHDPVEQARVVEERTGVRTVAGRDLMVLDVGEEVSITDELVYSDDWIPPSSV